jgi:hypothetical protein
VGHLTGRGWAAKTPLITSTDAADFKARCAQSHTVQYKVNVTRWSGGVNNTLATDVPVTGGTLSIDSSDVIRRRLTLEIGGGEDWVPRTSTSPLVPFGQYVHLFCRIDKADGSWTPWLKLFEGPIQTNVFERPSLMSTVEATDPSGVVDQYLHETKKGYGNRALSTAVKQMVDAALPGAIYNVEAVSTATGTRIDNFTAEAGSSRWVTANELAGKHAHEAYFDWNADLIIRHDLSDEDDASYSPAGVGPDIGTVTNPVAVIRDGQGGNLLGVTASITREGSANAVVTNLTALVKKTAKKGSKKTAKKQPTREIWWTHIAKSTGTIAYGDTFGRAPIVSTKSVARITPQMKAAKRQYATRQLKRRAGLVRYLDIDCLPIPFLEADDKVNVTFGGGTESHYVQSISLDLAGGPMRIRTRQVTVTDPGDLG